MAKTKKILALKSIRNVGLRNRKDLSLFEKTSYQIHEFESADKFKEWVSILTVKERKRVRGMFGYSSAYWQKNFGLPSGITKTQKLWNKVIEIIKDEDWYNTDNAIKKLESKFNITVK